MAINFNDLKKSRKSDFEKLQKKIEEETSSKGGSQKPTNEWSPATDKAGNGYSVIRFLPQPAGEDTAFVRVFSHGFKGPTGKWYIENSRTTLGEEDPVGKLNSELWNASEDDNSATRKQARAQKRRLSYVSNIYVVKDPANPDNEGKVFLFKYGKKIWDKINGAMNPEFEDEDGFNPFDLWEGANFKLKIRQVEGYRNYDKSEFDKPAPLADDSELEGIWGKCYSLQTIVSPDKFKSYADLEKQLKIVLGGNVGTASRAVPEDRAEQPKYTPRSQNTTESKSDDAPPTKQVNTDNTDDDLAFFESLSQ